MRDFTDNYKNADAASAYIAVLAKAENELAAALYEKQKAYNALKNYEKEVYEPKENWYFAVNDGKHPVELKAFLPEWNSIVEARKGYSDAYEAKNKAFKDAKSKYDDAKSAYGIQGTTSLDKQVESSEKQSGEGKSKMNPILKWSLIGGGVIAITWVSYLLIKKIF